MSREIAEFDRRTLLRGALATAALAPIAGTLASCGGSSSPSAGGGAQKSATNPFGLAKTSSVEAVIFNGG
jgi:N-acetylglucosamine transport system substrate-binding protein